VEVWLHLLDSIEIDDDRTVDAHKLRRIESSFQVIHLFAKQMRFAPRVQLRVIPVCFDEIDLLNFQQHHPSRRLDHQPRQVTLLLVRTFAFALAILEQSKQTLAQLVDLARRNLRLRPLQCPRKSLVVKRLQKVVERMNLEGFQRILVECSNKDDGLNLFGSNSSKHIEAIHLRHLNVEKDEI